ncbi:MAG: hypothetical protein KDD45_17455 [Bdellovibrionales bacterium]|nr:hypothetical protein [Bdellovibrionales bacterium]
MIEEGWSRESSERGIIRKKNCKKNTGVQILKKSQTKGLIPTINKSLSMLKRIIEMQNVGGNVRKMNSKTVVKVMMIFWFALLVQIRLNQNARKTVIKTLYVMGGMVTVLGLVGTTGILAYKHWNGRKNS